MSRECDAVRRFSGRHKCLVADAGIKKILEQPESREEPNISRLDEVWYDKENAQVKQCKHLDVRIHQATPSLSLLVEVDAKEKAKCSVDRMKCQITS